MPMQLGAAESDTPAEAFQQYEEEFNNVVKAVESINNNVYYIPGNVRSSVYNKLLHSLCFSHCFSLSLSFA